MIPMRIDLPAAYSPRMVLRLLGGNEIGVLLADWLLAQARSQGTLPARSAVLGTIVSDANVGCHCP